MAMHVYLTALAAMTALAAQSGAAEGNVVAAGYTLTTYFTAAPGQVLTVLVQGINAPPSGASASTGQWPTVLGGISATFTGPVEGVNGNTTAAVPIGSVYPFWNCALGQDAQPPCGMTGLTLQIPFGKWLAPGNERLFYAVLKISDAQGNSATALVFVPGDQVHILKTDDSILGGGSPVFGGFPIIVHADGTLVGTPPAQPGETLVMYAVGLGNTNPPVASGAPSPASPLSVSLTVAQQPFGLRYDFTPNAPPSPGVPGTSTTSAPVFAGLSPGSTGLYQVNFVVPIPPPGTPPCGSPVGTNLTVTLIGYSSFDGAGICVDVSAPSHKRPG